MIQSIWRYCLDGFQSIRLSLFIGIIYLLLVLMMTWPLAARLSTHVTPGHQGILMVSQLNVWTLAWNHHWMQHPSKNSYWHSNNFYPHQYALAYSEPQFATSFLTLPLALLGVPPVLIYNLIFLLFWAASGWAVYLLTLEVISGRSSHSVPITARVAAFLAGLLFGFCPYMIRELGVLQLFALAFPPLALLFLLRFAAKPSWRNVILSSLCYIVCWNTCAYYGIFLTVFIMALLVMFWSRKWLSKDYLVPGSAAAVLILICMLPLARGMLAPKEALSLDRPVQLVEKLSAVIYGYVIPPSNSVLYGGLLDVGRPGNTFFIGGLLILLGLIGFGILGRKLGSLRVGRYFKVMAILALLLSFGTALAPSSPDGLGLFSFVYWLSPYNLLYEFFPGYSSIRSPYRFSIFVALFMAVLAGSAFYWLLTLIKSKYGRIIAAAVSLSLALAELWPREVRLYALPTSAQDVSKVYSWLAEKDDGGAVIELPMHTPRGRPTIDAEYMYASMFHWHPLVNGYSGFAPRAYQELLGLSKAEGSPQRLLAGILAFSPRYVIIHWDKVSALHMPVWREMTQLGLRPIIKDGEVILYETNKPTTPRQDLLKQVNNSEAFASYHEVPPAVMCHDGRCLKRRSAGGMISMCQISTNFKKDTSPTSLVASIAST